ncbi:hypothetical protein ACHAP8_006812 [Fusarium lateritium]
MKPSTLLLTSQLLGSVNAFLAYRESIVERLVEDGVSEACGKVMLTGIDCDASLDGAGRTGWEGSIEGDDNFTITDSICAKKCGDSLKEWAEAFANHCEPEHMRTPNMVEGRRQICDKDAKTGKYCNTIIDSFPLVSDDEELAAKYLCEPCYVRRLWGFDLSTYSPANSWIITQRERMDELCPKSVLVEKKVTSILKHPLSTAQPWLDSLETSASVNSEAETTSTPESTETASSTTTTEPFTTEVPSTTAVTSATEPSESNASERIRHGYWSLLLVLGINVFYL